jgi:hypothetical protein
MTDTVAIDGRQDNVAEALPLADGLGDVGGLGGIEGRRPSIGLDGTEATTPRALPTHQHDRGRSARRHSLIVLGFFPIEGAVSGPAFPNVGAPGLFAHGVQVQRPQLLLQLVVGAVEGDGRLLQPSGQVFELGRCRCRPGTIRIGGRHKVLQLQATILRICGLLYIGTQATPAGPKLRQ